MKNILNTITQRLTAARDQHQTAEQKFRALITKAATSGGDLPPNEAGELVTIAEHLGISTEALEAKVSTAIDARMRFEELVKTLQTMPTVSKRWAAAATVVKKAEAHLAEVKAKAEAELAAAQNAHGDALREHTRVGNMAAELAELYKGSSAEFLPEQTPEILYMQSRDFQSGDPVDPEKDYTQPMWKASISTYVPRVRQYFRAGELIREEVV